MTIASAIENARNKIATAYQTVENMGGTLPTTQNLENLPIAIESVVTTGPLIDGSATEVDTSVSSIRGSAFANCTSLNTVILRSNTVVDLSDDTIFENTPIENKTGNIYVPDELINGYKDNAKIWNTFLAPRTLPSTLLCVFYANNIFIMGTLDGLAYSYDGENWNRIYGSSTLNSTMWASIAYGNGKFVAVNAGNSSSTSYASTSTDGITWTNPVSFGTAYWSKVVFGNNKFVAVGGSGNTSTSTDGITWTTIKKVGSNSWNSVAYDGTKFVACNTGGQISTSTDGINWTTLTQVGSIYWNDITYGNNIFVMVGDGGHISTSNDGTNWTTPIQIKSSISWQSIAFDGSSFTICGSDGYIVTSTDGISWTTPTQIYADGTLSEYPSWSSITYGNKKYIMIGRESRNCISVNNILYNFLPISQLSTQ